MRREPVTPGPGTDDESEIYERLFAEAKEYVDEIGRASCRERV